MMNNLKLLGVFFLAILLFTNCNKENKQEDTQPLGLGEIEFAAIEYTDSEKDFDFECVDGLIIHHAYIVLEDLDGNLSTHQPLTFVLDYVLYTQSLKLDPGPYIIKEFSIRTEDQTIIKATPEAGAPYSEFVSTPINDLVDFTIVPFEKEQLNMDVLCFIEANVGDFGFEWFEVTEITVRQQCFFGDFCVPNTMDYIYTDYGPDVTVDEVALFKIVVTRNGDIANQYSIENVDVDGNIVAPLCVNYADYDATEDTFEFDLYIKVNDGNGGFGYEWFHTWTFMDDETIVPIYIEDLEDGVVDFVLGDCVLTPTDLLLDPWPY